MPTTPLGQTSSHIATKAGRYLTDGRITVLAASSDQIRATAEGTSSYTIIGHPGGWTCTCPAASLCAHQVAVAAIAPPTTLPAHDVPNDPFDLIPQATELPAWLA